MSIGGRFGYDDDGQTPNTQIVFFDYQPAPIIFEVRGLPRKKGDNLMDANHIRTSTGTPIQIGQEQTSPNNAVVIICEHGYLNGSVIYDNNGKKIKQFDGNSRGPQANFISPV